jgi:hypothetical protein
MEWIPEIGRAASKWCRAPDAGDKVPESGLTTMIFDRTAITA